MCQEERCLLVALEDATIASLPPEASPVPPKAKHRKRISVLPGSFIRLEELPTKPGKAPSHLFSWSSSRVQPGQGLLCLSGWGTAACRHLSACCMAVAVYSWAARSSQLVTKSQSPKHAAL